LRSTVSGFLIYNLSFSDDFFQKNTAFISPRYRASFHEFLRTQPMQKSNLLLEKIPSNDATENRKAAKTTASYRKKGMWLIV